MGGYKSKFLKTLGDIQVIINQNDINSGDILYGKVIFNALEPL
jgi:hypothetical protein